MRTVWRILAIALKEVMHILRDPQLLAFALVMPVVLILLFGYAVSFDIDSVPLAVIDRDRSPESRRLVEAFTAGGTFELVAEGHDPDAAGPLMRRGVAKAVLVIPAGYQREVKRGGEADAQLLLDGSDNTTAAIALGYANSFALDVSLGRFEVEVGEVELPLEARTRTLYNAELKSSVFLVPGLIVLIMVMIAVMLTALTIAREYEWGSMEQLFTTPVGRIEIILGKLGPYFVLGLVDVLLVLVMGATLFDVPMRGSLLLLFAVASLFLLAMLMQGLVISTVTRNQMLASQAAMVSTFLPALLLSGFVFPVENMPAPIQAVANVMPAKYFVHALRAILLRGNGFDVIAPDLLAMGAFFLLMLAVSIKRFRRSLA